MKGLYIHIPFCEHICHYCDFVKRIPKDEGMMSSYIDVLINEIKDYQAHFDSIKTIYIGGGTPSMLSIKNFEKLFNAIKDIQPTEFTIEVNPESYTEEKGILFYANGVNRISLGVQTFHQDILKSLNRKHKNQDVFDAIKHLRKIGIDNISVDLIYGLPKQTLEDLDNDLKIINALKIPHVSAYSLILEEKTVFYHRYLKGDFKPISEDLEALMYEQVMVRLKSFGYEHYEISNFAKEKQYSMHNMIYWSNEPFIGVGMGAHGFIDGYRTYNQKTLPLYEKHYLMNKILIDAEEMMRDMLIFGLRKINGVSIKSFKQRYHKSVFDVFPQIYEKIELGLLEVSDDMLKLTYQGLFLGNQVFMVFV